jgi:hypothetical protein
MIITSKATDISNRSTSESEAFILAEKRVDICEDLSRIDLNGGNVGDGLYVDVVVLEELDLDLVILGEHRDLHD